MIPLKWTKKKHLLVVWIGFIWMRVGASLAVMRKR